jgi:nitroreductase
VIFVHSQALIPTPLEDSILAAYNIVLTAETMGLGSCFVSLAQNAMNSSRALKKIVGMDPREQIHAVVVVGYPAVRFRRAIPRRPVPIAAQD